MTVQSDPRALAKAFKEFYGPARVDALISDWGAASTRPLTRWERVRSRMRRASYRARRWIAVKALRLSMGDDE